VPVPEFLPAAANAAADVAETKRTHGPVLLRPRLDAKPWGGGRLARFGFALPDGEGPLGEALLTDPAAVLETGPFAGEALGVAAVADPAGFVGDAGFAATSGRPVFPLLAKFVDAGGDLSIQVHPGDELARAQGEATGKTEAWHVLAAEPGAAVWAGLAEGVSAEQFVEAIQAGGEGAVGLLRRLPAVPGTTFVLPAGCVHALGAGVLVYEIQQPCNTTYRLFDWGRVDDTGRPRDLHLDLGLRALDPTPRPEPIATLPLPTLAGQRDLLAACRSFALERIVWMVGDRVWLPASPSPQVVTCLGGALRLRGDGGRALLQTGDTAVIPAGGVCTVDVIMPSVALRGWVPDLVADVVRPLRAEGASDDRIAAMAGPLPDLREAMSSTP
jgi:mannose-6-phosphate isomerase